MFFELLGSKGCKVTGGETKEDIGMFIPGLVCF